MSSKTYFITRVMSGREFSVVDDLKARGFEVWTPRAWQFPKRKGWQGEEHPVIQWADLWADDETYNDMTASIADRPVKGLIGDWLPLTRLAQLEWARWKVNMVQAWGEGLEAILDMERELERLRNATEEEDREDAKRRRKVILDDFRVRQSVLIEDGPFKDKNATYHATSADGTRYTLEIELFGKPHVIEVDAMDVDAA